jgi:hypothetical protein
VGRSHREATCKLVPTEDNRGIGREHGARGAGDDREEVEITGGYLAQALRSSRLCVPPLLRHGAIDNATTQVSHRRQCAMNSNSDTPKSVRY